MSEVLFKYFKINNYFKKIKYFNFNYINYIHFHKHLLLIVKSLKKKTVVFKNASETFFNISPEKKY